PGRSRACASRCRRACRWRVRARPAPTPRGPEGPASGPSGLSPAWCRRRHRPAATPGACGCRAGSPCGCAAPPYARRHRWCDAFPRWPRLAVPRYSLAASHQRKDPRPGHHLRQRRPFHRPLCDADLRCRRDHHGAGARHGLFGAVAVRDARLRG
ncbi:hypothetical protein KXW38_000950, partial [Aspergillus fumigatus]